MKPVEFGAPFIMGLHTSRFGCVLCKTCGTIVSEAYQSEHEQWHRWVDPDTPLPLGEPQSIARQP